MSIDTFLTITLYEQGATFSEVASFKNKAFKALSKQPQVKSDIESVINSDLDKSVKLAIVAHDLNGIINNEQGFLPKSHNFSTS